MNQEQMNKAIDKLLPEVLENAAQARKANASVKISGTRHVLALNNRNIDMAYYQAPTEHAPLFVAYHGGGFLFGGSCLDDELWINVCKELNVNVASINYRMAPEVMDYASLDDAYDSAVYLANHAEEYGFDAEHISVFGSSAGGNLAAAVAILAKQRGDLKLDYQILMYPFLDGFTNPDEKGNGSFSGLLPHIMNRLHFTPENANDPLLSPYFATTDMLTGLPKAIVSYCEDDNLRHEAMEYCQKLRAAGVEVHEFFAEKMPHGYIESGFKHSFSGIVKTLLGSNADELISSGLLRKTSEDTLAFIRSNME